MAQKEILFATLVKNFGKPEVVTLWGDPKRNAGFMKLVESGRIVILIQKPTGNRKDFGLIGFHPQPMNGFSGMK